MALLDSRGKEETRDGDGVVEDLRGKVESVKRARARD
jgi:hypothetical protein